MDNKKESIRPMSMSLAGYSSLASTESAHSSTTNDLADGGISSKKKGRKLIIFRHGERIDFTFNSGHENWVARAFDSNGKYKRFNINMPRSVPNRKDGYMNYMMDTPLTEMGYLQAKISGRALRDAGVKPDHIYASSALRCIQTSVGLMKGMNNTSLRLNVEPGLFEWGAWCRPKMPVWISAQELGSYGYPINVSYNPLIPATSITSAERLSEYYERSYQVVQQILDRHPQDCTIILVAHGASLETLTRQLIGSTIRNQQEFYSILHQTPYLAMAAAGEDPVTNKWSLVEPPILPFQHQNNCSYNWRVLTVKLLDGGR